MQIRLGSGVVLSRSWKKKSLDTTKISSEALSMFCVDIPLSLSSHDERLEMEKGKQKELKISDRRRDKRTKARLLFLSYLFIFL